MKKNYNVWRIKILWIFPFYYAVDAESDHIPPPKAVLIYTIYESSRFRAVRRAIWYKDM